MRLRRRSSSRLSSWRGKAWRWASRSRRLRVCWSEVVELVGVAVRGLRSLRLRWWRRVLAWWIRLIAPELATRWGRDARLPAHGRSRNCVDGAPRTAFRLWWLTLGRRMWALATIAGLLALNCSAGATIVVHCVQRPGRVRAVVSHLHILILKVAEVQKRPLKQLELIQAATETSFAEAKMPRADGAVAFRRALNGANILVIVELHAPEVSVHAVDGLEPAVCHV